MKNFNILFAIFLLTSLQLGLVAQQQGFGCILNHQYKSFSGDKTSYNSDSLIQRSSVNPICSVPPIFGKSARTKGRTLPLPFGIGIYSIYYSQGYTADDLRLIPDSSSLVARADTVYQNTTAYEFKTQVRPNFWLFPFLNIYGIFGYTKGVISPKLVVPYIVVENIPIIDSLIIDSTFQIVDEIGYVGPTYGFGATFSMGISNYFIMVDYNYSITNPVDVENNLHNHFLSPKVGILLGNKKRKSFGAIWLGAMYIHNDQSFKGKISVDEINPELVFLLGEEATYSGKISAKQRWNFVIGGSLVLNNRHHLVLEAGFFERKQISFGYDFRF
jgi:hypothetical protein